MALFQIELFFPVCSIFYRDVNYDINCILSTLEAFFRNGYFSFMRKLYFEE